MAAEGTSQVELVGDDTLVVVFRGRQAAHNVRATIQQVEGLLGTKKLSPFDQRLGGVAARPLVGIRFVYFALDGIEAFSPNVAGPGNDLLALLKKHGVELAVASTTNAAIRMMGQTLSFAVGVKLRFVTTRAEAFARFSELRMK